MPQAKKTTARMSMASNQKPSTPAEQVERCLKPLVRKSRPVPALPANNAPSFRTMLRHVRVATCEAMLTIEAQVARLKEMAAEDSKTLGNAIMEFEHTVYCDLQQADDMAKAIEEDIERKAEEAIEEEQENQRLNLKYGGDGSSAEEDEEEEEEDE